MTSPDAVRSFLDKWRAQWPEWALAEAFVPADQRDVAVAWFALLHEWSDAAWGGADPAPGLAKLAWWQEELRGWAKGARRHPLGELLQPRPVPWQAVADTMGVLRHRGLPADGHALDTIEPLRGALAQAEAALFGGPPGATASHLAMLAPTATGQGGCDAARRLLAAGCAQRPAARPVRLLAALVNLRLGAAAAEPGDWRPAGRWRSLWALWRAARN